MEAFEIVTDSKVEEDCGGAPSVSFTAETGQPWPGQSPGDLEPEPQPSRNFMSPCLPCLMFSRGGEKELRAGMNTL